MLTKEILACDCADSASSAKSAASCLHATTRSGSASAAWNAPASLRHSSRCTVIACFDLSAPERLFASSGIVPLQEQSLSVLLSSDILGFRQRFFRCFFFRVCFCLLDFFYRLLFLVKQQATRVVERLQHFGGNRILSREIDRVRLERINRLEVSVGEELLQRRAPRLEIDARVHERREVRIRLQVLNRGQHGGCGGRERRRCAPCFLR